MNSIARSLPDSFHRYVDGEAPANLHPCAVIGCNGMAFAGKYCARCTEEIVALDAWATRCEERRARRHAARQALWNSLMTWTPTDEQLARLAHRFECAGRILDRVLKTAVILGVIYLAIEIGLAFLPGGAVSRVLGGLH
jgi:hypothetical protein